MRDGVARYIRGAQVQMPWMFGLKNAAQRGMRRAMRQPFDRDFKALADLKLPADGLVLDIGGNRGQSIDAVRLYMPQARIVSFEPNPDLAAQLSALFATDDRVKIHNVALGPEPAELPLFIPYYNGWMFDGLASLERGEAMEWLNGRNLAGFQPDKLDIREVRVKVRTLDSFEAKDPVFIKIDVQGFEPQVLDGGRETIARARPVIMLEAIHEIDMLKHLPDEYEPAHFDGTALKRGYSRQVNVFYLPREIAERF